jgi:succinate-semialdehyde dehydrogenase / glutarate-semialdehyde dehydrogenase
VKKLISTNPSQGYKTIGWVNISTEKEIKAKVALAQKAKGLWKETSLDTRIGFIKKLMKAYEKQYLKVAKLVSTEMGKPITQSIGDAKNDMASVKNRLGQAKKHLSPIVLDKTKDQKNVLYFEPLGLVAVIVPWNYPSPNFFISCIQTLLAGNTVVFKHSEETPLVGKLLEEITDKAGFPEGVISFVHGDGKVGDILTDQDIDAIHFTGSSKVGQYLYQKAAKKFIPAVLEMGGSSPGIVFKDADIDAACENACMERFTNCGQICCALKRLFVHEDIFDKVVSKMKCNLEAMKIGDSLKKDTEVGPLVAKRQLDLLVEQVRDAKKKGATIVTGGNKAEGMDGAFFQPTIITGVKPNMKVMTEEVFGPVLPIVSFKTDEEAIELANKTIYGLSAYVYGKNVAKLRKMASQIDAGQVSINGASYFSSNSPFGGYKMSGLGRGEGLFGYYDVTQKKVVAEPVNK